MILPFALLLAAIALGPLVAHHLWDRQYPKISLALGALTLGYYLFVLHNYSHVGQAAHEYASFIALVGSLFVVSGGVHVRVKSGASPAVNVLFLLAGAVLANVLGTTGAAMLMIRPWIRMNQHRIAAYHVVFFIFIVANVGGCLTPIGDPPLFLGYLSGVPFWWVIQNAWPMWLIGVGLLLAVFYVMDVLNSRRHPAPTVSAGPPEAWGFSGAINLLFLAVILGAVFVDKPAGLRESLMFAAGIASYFLTDRKIHAANDFNFRPIQEVAILFIGIFATMMPALDWLNTNARELLGQHPSAGIFFWGTGLLSSVLDNAPTYLGFLSALFGVSGTDHMDELLRQHSLNVLAISIGAVFFGAATYIGNGPNFMVKAVADQNRVPTASFLGFLFRYALPILLPVLLIIWLVFFNK
jgi:Na+/H+ antiporter NhaD/arsenite permease-like protein